MFLLSLVFRLKPNLSRRKRIEFRPTPLGAKKDRATFETGEIVSRVTVEETTRQPRLNMLIAAPTKADIDQVAAA